jgi:hypothetical protein
VYNHVETPIIANGNFVLESVIRTNGPGGWGSGITVYWDTTHFLRFFLDLYVTKWWSNESTGEMINALGSTVAGTNTWLTLRIEFGTDKIKFYAGPTGGTLTYLPEFDEARVASTKWANALLIVGKGYQRPTLYDKPDLDNDYTADGAANFQGFDYISYQPSNVNYCGDQGTIYFDSDLYPDCRVNMRDMAEFLTQWLWCTDPADEFCDQFWTP